jgi:hypothetical protein
MTTMYRRKRTNDQRQDDGVQDDVLRDGEFLRVPMTLADHALRDTVRATHPPRMHYGRGYLRDTTGAMIDARPHDADWPTASAGVYNASAYTAGDPCTCEDGSAGRLAPHPSIVSALICQPNGRKDSISDPTREGGWTMAASGVVPAYNNTVGARCTINGKAGTLQPHPTNMSALLCVPDAEDAASVLDSTAVYYAERAKLSDEWKRWPAKPLRDGCGCHGVNDVYNNEQGQRPPVSNRQNVNWPRKEWPHGGYNDPSAVGGSQWPNPDSLASVREGDQCMTNAKEPGVIRNGVCVAAGRDQAMTNIGPPTARAGFEWAEGGECSLGNGDTGLYVKQGGMLVCRARSEFDARSVGRDPRDAAYEQMVADARTAWQRW